MCGIIGAWTTNSGNIEKHQEGIAKALKQLVHRGPDDQGVWVNPRAGVVLGHRRLSIIDLSSSGHQPMVSEQHKLCVVYNGEIYNYIELKQLLQSKGYVFKSKSDTEVLLNAYLYYEEDFVKHLRGMFSFSLWDGRKKKLVLARDRAGKKPLYYARNSSGIYFASEINALKILLPADALELDMDALNSYLSNGAVTGDRTIFKDMKEVPPATLFVCESPARIRKKKYWQINWCKYLDISLDEAVTETEKILTESVKLRLRSDVPVGIFLSGGIDSGLITAITARNFDNDIQTFCIGFDDSEFDERPLARLVAKKYNTKHTEIVLRPDIVSFLPKIARAYGEPFADPSAVPSYFISQFVSKYVKVILNGDGGDELFCGYRRHVASLFLNKFRSIIPKWMNKSLISNIVKMSPAPKAHRSKYGYAHRFLRAMKADKMDRYLILSSDGFDNEQKHKLYKQSNDVKRFKKVLNHENINDDEMNALELMVRLDFESSLPEILLKKIDIASMAHGLEARSPFLDHELITWAFSIPFSVRLSGAVTKPLLRDLSKKYLPIEITKAPKRGFEIPLLRWLNNDLARMRDDIILSNTGLLSDLFNRTYLESLLKGKIREQLDPGRWANLVWILLMLGLWDQACWRN